MHCIIHDTVGVIIMSDYPVYKHNEDYFQCIIDMIVCLDRLDDEIRADPANGGDAYGQGYEVQMDLDNEMNCAGVNLDTHTVAL